MSYDENLAQRARDSLAGQPGLAEKKMFGGLAFLVQGNMCCGVHDDDLIVRVGPARHAEALARPHVREFDLSMRPAPGWVLVAPPAVASPESLEAWIEEGVAFALSLPPK